MKTGELLKKLRRYGCYIIRHGNRHDIWYSPATGKEFPAPRHKAEVKTGTVKSIFKDAGI